MSNRLIVQYDVRTMQYTLQAECLVEIIFSKQR